MATDFSIEEKVNLLFKKNFGTPSTRNDIAFYQEPSIKNLPNVNNSQVWSESDKIPYTVPTALQNATTDDQGNSIVGSKYGKTIGVLRKYVDLELEVVDGSSNHAYQAPLFNGERALVNTVPFNHNNFSDSNSYLYKLKKQNGDEIYFGIGEWVLDPNTGILTFYQLEAFTSNDISNNFPPTISFYRYVGEIGINNIIQIDKSINLKTESTDYNSIKIKSSNAPIHLDGNGIIINNKNGLKLPVGNTSERPYGNILQNGMIRFNTDLNQFEGYNNAWNPIGSGGGAGNGKAIENEIGSCKIETDLNTSPNSIIFTTSSIDRAIINQDGNVGIGTTTPNAGIRLDVRGVISGEIGAPTSGNYGSNSTNISSILTDDKIADSIQKLENVLKRIAPDVPPGLSTKTLDIVDKITGNSIVLKAYNAGTTDEINLISDSTPRTNEIKEFFNGNKGRLESLFDSSSNSVNLNTNSNVGTYGNLIVTEDKDYYSGIAGKENFWNVLSAYININTPLTNGQNSHSIQLKHNDTGNTNEIVFFVDDSVLPTISGTPIINDEGIVNNVNSHYVSGILTYNNTSTISTSFTVNNVISSHYNGDGLGKITSNNNAINIKLEKDESGRNVSNYIRDSSHNLTLTSNFSNNAYTEQLIINAIALNSIGNEAIVNINNKNSKNIRIDTVSNTNIINHVTSGIGQYPNQININFGTSYDHTESLMVNQELQLLNGLFQKPSNIDFSNVYPLGSPDYSNVNLVSSSAMTDDYRYSTFKFTSGIDCKTGLNIIIHNQAGTGWGSNSEIGTDMRLNVKVYDSSTTSDSGWLDANSIYEGYGIPNKDGDSCLLIRGTTNNNKKITFGTSRTGDVYIRIGLLCGSGNIDKKFSYISISSENI